VGADDESPERTLPEALDVRQVTLEDARHSVAAPDTVNAKGYVVSLVICPDDADCILPSGIEVAETPHPEESSDAILLGVDEPRQFVKGARYVLSLRVTNPAQESDHENLLSLIGYTRVQE
jgi:hypothetical protein